MSILMDGEDKLPNLHYYALSCKQHLNLFEPLNWLESKAIQAIKCPSSVRVRVFIIISEF